MSVAHVSVSRGFFAVIDAADVELVSAYRWHCHVKSGGRVYAMTNRKGHPGQKIALHRLIVAAPAGASVDHVNGDTLDNRRCNLRICSAAQNNHNCRPRVKNKVGFKGVTARCSGRTFHARIGVPGVKNKLYLGAFKTPTEAALAYDTAAKQFFGEFARLNFPDGSSVASHEPHHVEI